MILKGNKGGEVVMEWPTNLKLERLRLLGLKEQGEEIELLFAGQGGMADAAQTELSKIENSILSWQMCV